MDGLLDLEIARKESAMLLARVVLPNNVVRDSAKSRRLVLTESVFLMNAIRRYFGARPEFGRLENEIDENQMKDEIDPNLGFLRPIFRGIEWRSEN